MSVIYKLRADFGNVNGTWDWVTIYDPENITSAAAAIHQIPFSAQAGAAGSLSFKVPVSHPKYDNFRVLGVSVEILADNAPIWFGRVISISKDFYNEKTVTCEGGLAFLGDILIRPFKYFHSGSGDPWNGKNVDVTDYRYGHDLASDIITKYDMYASAKRKAVLISYDTDLYSLNTAEFTGVNDYKTTLDALKNIISSDDNALIHWEAVNSTNFGGEAVGLYIIDVTKPFTSGGGTITLTQNLVDYSSVMDGGDIFTRIVPLDKDRNTAETASTDPTVPSDCIAGTLTNTYGNIERIYKYNDTATSAELWGMGYDIMTDADSKNTSAPSELTVNAVDMALTPGGSGVILVGKSYTITSAFHGLSGTYNCTGLKVTLDEPGSAVYTFLKPDEGAALRNRQLTEQAGAYSQNDEVIAQKAVYDDDEAPERFVKIDDNHIVAVMNGRAEHYLLDNFATDPVPSGDQEHYHLEVYETTVPANLPS